MAPTLQMLTLLTLLACIDITATATADIALSLLHLRTSLLSQHSLVDISRCALTTIHYPEQRTLTADEPTAEPLPATMQHLAATAEALLAGGGHRWPTSAAAVQACDTSASSGGHHQSAADPTAAVKDPSSHQADSSNQLTEGFSRPGVTAKEGQQSEGQIDRAAVRHHTAGYDPVWMLLWAVKVNLAAMVSSVTMISTVTMVSIYSNYGIYGKYGIYSNYVFYSNYVPAFPLAKARDAPSHRIFEAASAINCHMTIASSPVWQLVHCAYQLFCSMSSWQACTALCDENTAVILIVRVQMF